jgi:hypothetical protein
MSLFTLVSPDQSPQIQVTTKQTMTAKRGIAKNVMGKAMSIIISSLV